MNQLNKIAITLLAGVAMAGAAVAAGSDANNDNWRNNHDNLQWMNGDGTLCWRDNNWTPETAAANCDGALKKVAPAPVAPSVAPAAPEVRPAPVAPPASVSKVKYGADALFDFDKSVLKPEGRAKLDDLIAKIRGLDLEVIVAVGHTDAVGSNAYNQSLSVRRANAVKAYLVSKGIEASRVYAEGKGETQPVANNKTSAGRAQNRRVEIEVVGTQKK